VFKKEEVENFIIDLRAIEHMEEIFKTLLGEDEFVTARVGK
jgi:hypothetical protein